MGMRRPKYTHGFIDRDDKPRFYLRQPGHKKVPLPLGLPSCPKPASPQQQTT